MTISDFKERLKDHDVPDDADIAFQGNGDGSFYQVTDEVNYDESENQVNIGY